VPLHEYRCRACHHEFERLVRDSSAQSCPACQSQDLERLLSLFGVDSESTRKAALKDGRKHAAKEQRDKAIAEHEAAHHAHDH
jgi:putative FmdB family regulatory protein